ncbi:hypothetical protein Tco_1498735 [Tanacetum coccineum]
MKWIELFSDFDSEIPYHSRKANVVADVLSKVSKVENVTVEMLHGMDQLIERKEDGGIKFIWVPLLDGVRTLIMDEAYASRYLVHPGMDKTYYDLRDMYGGHADIGESSLIRPELVQETTDKVVLIKEKLKAARDHQKSYANNRRKPLEFEVGDQVLLGKKEMLAPRYVGPFEIIKGIDPMAY